MQIDPTILCTAFVLFYVSHRVADYWIQTDWQAQNKSKNLKALLTHALTYTLSFLPALALLHHLWPRPSWHWALAALAVGLPHALVDTRRVVSWFARTTKGWPDDHSDLEPLAGSWSPYGPVPGPNPAYPWMVATRFHVLIELDQSLHELCLLLLALALALR